MEVDLPYRNPTRNIMIDSKFKSQDERDQFYYTREVRTSPHPKFSKTRVDSFFETIKDDTQTFEMKDNYIN
jgi:hypothetical protein